MVIPRKIKGECDNFSYSFCNEDEVQIDPYTLLGEIFVNMIYIAFNIEKYCFVCFIIIFKTSSPKNKYTNKEEKRGKYQN